MILISSLVVALYSLLLLAFIVGFDQVKKFKGSTNENDRTKFSVIIPFRNEAIELPTLLDSISQLEYPTSHFEIIFINDDSDDASVEIIELGLDTKSVQTDSARPDIRIIPNIRKTNSPKKDAINTAIHQAKYDWIITTDADCTIPTTWLQTFHEFICENQPRFIVAPVTYQIHSHFIEQFQLLDFLSLQGSTIGAFGIKKPFLCNGANLCYQKKVFFEVNGFEGNNHIASGDDIFLLEKIVQKNPEKVHYLKSRNATVKTKAQSTFKQLLAQRVRWAAKASVYQNAFSKNVSLVVFVMNFLLIVLLISSISGMTSWRILLFSFLVKWILDLILFIKTTSFFKQYHVLKHYVLSSILYPFFILAVVLYSFSSGYSWKGRKFKK